MNIEELHDYCLTIKGSKESFPFDEFTLVFKVYDKMFALIPLDSVELRVALKCDSQKAEELREKYSCVEPAHHFNKKYWNSIYLNRGMSDEEIKFWIRHSVGEVVKKLPKRIQNEYYQN